jgi:hypothetical protein
MLSISGQQLSELCLWEVSAGQQLSELCLWEVSGQHLFERLWQLLERPSWQLLAQRTHAMLS